MQIHNQLSGTFFSCRKRIFLLAFFWIGGLLAGVYAAGNADESVLSLMRTGTFSGVSIVTSCAAHLFPVFVTALAFFIAPVLILPIAFCKAASFGFVSSCISSAFHSAGWLVRLLVMFSDTGMTAVLLWLWIRCLCTRRKLPWYAVLISSLCVAALCSIDYFILTPLSGRLAVH